jgi:hypothetical protein
MTSKNKLDDQSRFIIQNEYFLTESSLAEYIKCDALPRLSFQNFNF